MDDRNKSVSGTSAATFLQQAEDERKAFAFARNLANERRDYDLDQGDKAQKEILNRQVANEQSAADQLRQVHTQLFGDMIYTLDEWSNRSTNAFVDFCFTGKAAFSDLVSSMLRDLARLAVQKNASGPLFDWIGKIIGAWGSTASPSMGGQTSSPTTVTTSYDTPAASGGYRDGSMPYLVGERGPEIFTPRRSGTITPNSAIGGQVNNISISVSVASDGQTDVKTNGKNGVALGQAIRAAVQQELMTQQRSGGLLA